MSPVMLQLAHELQKLLARKRAYFGFGSFLLIECAILFVCHRPQSREYFRRLIEPHGLDFNSYFSGLTLGLRIVAWTALPLGALFVALVSGDVMSKEGEEGTLRMLLCRPVSRTRLAGLKYISCLVYTLGLVLFLAASALATAGLYRGIGSLFVPPTADSGVAWHETRTGFERYCAAMPLLALSLTSVTSLGFLFSCFNVKPAAATLATLSVVYLDWIFSSVPYFASFRPWFLASRISAWQQIFATTIPWRQVCGDYAWVLALDAACFVTALAVFQRRDFKA